MDMCPKCRMKTGETWVWTCSDPEESWRVVAKVVASFSSIGIVEAVVKSCRGGEGYFQKGKKVIFGCRCFEYNSGEVVVTPARTQQELFEL